METKDKKERTICALECAADLSANVEDEPVLATCLQSDGLKLGLRFSIYRFKGRTIKRRCTDP
ncbi:hypothetical protein HanRHA438_Chr15g0690111 [Helianthus annuus]|nr:hypothetical protein HanRHA438_Chr15g0690111 [Helianthus annuus]